MDPLDGIFYMTSLTIVGLLLVSHRLERLSHDVELVLSALATQVRSATQSPQTGTGETESTPQ